MRLKCSFLVLFFSAIFMIAARAQVYKKVPKQYSFEIGYRNLFAHNNILLNHTHGYGGMFDYAWQLSGFDGQKNASYISVPMGYTIIRGNDTNSMPITMLNYGWTVRHELAKNKKMVPFVGYGLFLNDLKLKGVEGSVFGHQTEFDLGVNFITPMRLQYFIKLQYSYTSYPRFYQTERIKLHYADLRIGLRF